MEQHQSLRVSGGAIALCQLETFARPVWAAFLAALLRVSHSTIQLKSAGDGDDLDQTACSPRSHGEEPVSEPRAKERIFLLRRPGGEMGSFASIAGAETTPTREFGRHVFEIAALMRNREA